MWVVHRCGVRIIIICVCERSSDFLSMLKTVWLIEFEISRRMKANCNYWLTFGDERYTLPYESLRRVNTTNESTRIITHLNFFSRFEYLIMFSSSSFHIKKSRNRFISWLHKSGDLNEIGLNGGCDLGLYKPMKLLVIKSANSQNANFTQYNYCGLKKAYIFYTIFTR